MNKKTALVILDGWGIGDQSKSDAIYHANTPYMDELQRTRPHASLTTYGEIVGLPKGQMGNSEVGHLNIGAGRTVYQDLLKINRAIEDQSYFSNEKLLKISNYCDSNQKPLHILGLISDGGVHSNIEHILESALFFDRQGIKVFLHAFTDGRDTDPHSGINHLKQILSSIASTGIELASICGRYYAMDRDKRWERTKLAYDLLVNGQGTISNDFIQSVRQSYDRGVSDEFIEPIVHQRAKQDEARIKDGDAVFFVNFRTDRPRQLTEVLSQKDHPDLGMKTLDLFFSTMTEYDQQFQGLNVIYPKENIKETLGEILAAHSKTQLRAAETEKYPHVTFFFNGGREEPFEGEDRILDNSPKVATYDLKPEMSANELTNQCISFIEENCPDFICLNYANADMVGHTGSFEAVVQACETLDACVEGLVKVLTKNDYSILIIADHGNADFMINADGSPNTAHTKNPVPVILIDNDIKDLSLNSGNLTDIAVTILKLMGIEKGQWMTGKALF